MYIKYNSIKVAGCKCFKAKYKNEYLIVVGLFVFTLDFFHVIEFLVNKEFFSLSMLQVINHALIFLNHKNYFPLFWAINFVLNCHEQKFHNISFLMQSREKAVLVNTWRSCGVWVMSAERIRLDCLSSITSNSLLLTALLQSWALSPNVKACHKKKYCTPFLLSQTLFPVMCLCFPSPLTHAAKSETDTVVLHQQRYG